MDRAFNNFNFVHQTDKQRICQIGCTKNLILVPIVLIYRHNQAENFNKISDTSQKRPFGMVIPCLSF